MCEVEEGLTAGLKTGWYAEARLRAQNLRQVDTLGVLVRGRYGKSVKIQADVGRHPIKINDVHRCMIAIVNVNFHNSMWSTSQKSSNMK